MLLDQRQPGEALWPNKYSAEQLGAIRATIGPTKWAAMYQQVPRPEGGSEWPADYFNSGIWFDQWPSVGHRILALDPSKGRGDKWGDFSAFVKLQYCDGIMWVDADMANDRNTSIITETGIELQRTWGSEAFGVESNQFQEVLGTNMLELSKVRGVPLPLYLIDNRVMKEVRIRRLTPYLGQGSIRFKGGSPGAKLLVQQLIDFPNGEHDDGPDALEMAVRLLLQVLGQSNDDNRIEQTLQRVLQRI